MATWSFYAVDNGGKRHCYTIKAASKTEAIDKGMERARKNAAGDIGSSWECHLVHA